MELVGNKLNNPILTNPSEEDRASRPAPAHGELQASSPDTQTSHPQKMLFLGYKHPGTEIQLIQPRFGTSKSQELRYQSHSRKSGLEPYSKFN